MGIDRTRTDRPLAGVLVPDDRLEYRPAQSTTDEASPYPGTATPGRATSMALVASGTPEDEDTINVLALEGGLPIPGSSSFVWKTSTEAATAYKGWDQPTSPARFEVPTWDITATGGYRFPNVVALTDGSLVAAADFPSTAPGLEARRVVVRTRSTAGVWSGWTTVYTDASTTAGSDHMLRPCLLVLPNGDVELYHWTHSHESGGEFTQLVKQVSKDNGATWSITSERCLDNAIDTDVGGIRVDVRNLQVAHHAGQHMLVFVREDIGGGNLTMEQWSSRDGGNRFTQVDTLAALDDHKLIVAGGYFLLVYHHTTDTEFQSKRIGSAFDSILAATAVVVTNTPTAVNGLVVDDTGRVYAILQFVTVTFLYFSADYGDSWQTSGPSTNTDNQITHNDDGAFVRGDAAWWRGQIVWVTNTDPTAGTGDHSFIVIHWGGYTTLPMPFRYNTNTANGLWYQGMWEQNLVGIVDLDVQDTNLNQTGAGAAPSVSGGLLSFTGAAGTDRSYTWDDDNNLRPMATRMVVTVNDAEAHIIARVSDTTTDSWGARVEVDAAGGITLVDLDTGGTIATASITAATEVEIILHVGPGTTGNSDGTCAAWYRSTTGNHEERVYTEIGSSVTLSNAGATGNRRVRFRAISDGGAYDVDLREWSYLSHDSNDMGDVGASWSVPPTNPDDIRGREFSSRPVYVHDGVSIKALGLSVGGDTWTVAPRHTYEAERVLPSVTPSPSRGWRSQTGGEHILSYRFPDPDTFVKNDVLAIYLDGINFKRVEIERRTASAWVSLGTFDLYESIGYERIGDAIIPRNTGTPAANTIHLRRNELAGGVFEFPNGDVREIVSNTEGNWQRGAIAEKRASLYLDGITGAETTGPAAGAALWYPRALIIIPLDGSNRMESIRLTANPGGTDSDPPQGYLQIGTAAMGAVQVFGWAPDNSRSVALDMSGDELTVERSGITTREQVADPFRRVEFSWARSSKITTYQNDGDPDYVTVSSGGSAEPVATRYGAPLDWEGLMAEHGRAPLVYLPRIDHSASATVYRTGYAGGAIYGRYVPDSYRIETVRGYAERDETVRSSVVTIVEER